MRIRIFSIEKMEKMGCFFMTIPYKNYIDKSFIFYDPDKEITSEQDYLKLSEDRKIDKQCSMYQCCSTEEIKKIALNEFNVNLNEKWISIEDISIPNLENILFEKV